LSKIDFNFGNIIAFSIQPNYDKKSVPFKKEKIKVVISEGIIPTYVIG